MGEMYDATETLFAVLNYLHRASGGEKTRTEQLKSKRATLDEDDPPCDPSCCVHQVFGLHICEYTECACGASSEQRFCLFAHQIYVSEILSYKRSKAKTLPFDKLLSKISISYDKGCPDKAKNWCPQKAVQSLILENTPEVFIMDLVWAESSPSVDDIRDTLRLVGGTNIDTSNIFAKKSQAATAHTNYTLRGMITYYGLHYSAFFYCRSKSKWICFDDEKIKSVGATWEDVVQYCCRAHWQPSLLFYEQSATSTTLLQNSACISPTLPALPSPVPIPVPLPAPSPLSVSLSSTSTATAARSATANFTAASASATGGGAGTLTNAWPLRGSSSSRPILIGTAKEKQYSFFCSRDIEADMCYPLDNYPRWPRAWAEQAKGDDDTKRLDCMNVLHRSMIWGEDNPKSVAPLYHNGQFLPANRSLNNLYQNPNTQPNIHNRKANGKTGEHDQINGNSQPQSQPHSQPQNNCKGRHRHDDSTLSYHKEFDVEIDIAQRDFSFRGTFEAFSKSWQLIFAKEPKDSGYLGISLERTDEDEETLRISLTLNFIVPEFTFSVSCENLQAKPKGLVVREPYFLCPNRQKRYLPSRRVHRLSLSMALL